MSGDTVHRDADETNRAGGGTAAARWRRRGLVLAVLVACLALFFRGPVLSGFTRFHGDSYDGLIEIAILEHWHAVIAKGATWNLTGWFYPYADTLGYNDTNIVPGLFYAVARMAGSDPFIATLLAHVAMKTIGFLGMAALLRRGLGIALPFALLGAALFATANASLLHIYHAQLLAVGLIPWLMLLAIQAVRAGLEDRRRALLANGAGFGLLFGLTALNAFYQIWFFSLFLLAFVPIALIVASPAWRSRLWGAARRHWPILAAIAAVAALALIPFLMVYLPKLAEGARHPFAQAVRPHLPTLSTYVNVGQGNLVWGRLLGPMSGGEQRFGFPIGLLMLTLVAGAWAIRHHREARLMLAAAMALILLVLMVTRWTGNATLWEYLYPVIPGASGVRVISRILLFMLIPMIAMAMLFLQRWRAGPVTITLLCAFLLAEQVQLQAPLMIDRAEQLEMLASAGPPPAECDSFFVVLARTPFTAQEPEAEQVVRMWGYSDGRDLMLRYRHNVDAMLLAAYYDRPTIIGFSTFNPPDWAFYGPDFSDYPHRIRTYVAAHGLTRVCGLDRREPQPWFPLAP